ncbi:hypothetical protein UY3_00560 [Chelonia mydas]|uniref:Uncharacterized protein n=1 Tax=Chelonia mydas TaxID=8469 RepID=M7CBU3_CHEMY|nr:hypothetical protein UY3_00560 [Chelonia mydas]
MLVLPGCVVKLNPRKVTDYVLSPREAQAESTGERQPSTHRCEDTTIFQPDESSFTIQRRSKRRRNSGETEILLTMEKEGRVSNDCCHLFLVNILETVTRTQIQYSRFTENKDFQTY